MEIILQIPDELARQVASEGKDPARVALEALALEGYRAEQLSESAVRQILGFDSRIQVHAFMVQPHETSSSGSASGLVRMYS